MSQNEGGENKGERLLRSMEKAVIERVTLPIKKAKIGKMEVDDEKRLCVDIHLTVQDVSPFEIHKIAAVIKAGEIEVTMMSRQMLLPMKVDDEE